MLAMLDLAPRKVFAIAFLLCVATLSASMLSAWAGPTATAPAGNVAAPINVGATDQVKDAGISVNSLAVFGSQYIEDKLGIGRASPIVALDVNGTLRLGNGGEQCQAVSAGAVRYESASNALQYCDGSSWTSVGGGGGNLSAIRTFTSGTNVSYTPSDGVSSIVVEVWGGGGGGAAHNYLAGSGGGTSCFGTGATACASSVVSATGGGGGGTGAYPTTGAGGSGSGGDLNLVGGPGGAISQFMYGETNVVVGGIGGSAPRGGGGGAGAVYQYNYFQAPHGNAFGGGGSGEASSGGGGGGYAMKLITSPAASYTYTIGAGGAGGGGVSYYGFAGGSGGSGGIVVYEYTE